MSQRTDTALDYFGRAQGSLTRQGAPALQPSNTAAMLSDISLQLMFIKDGLANIAIGLSNLAIAIDEISARR